MADAVGPYLVCCINSSMVIPLPLRGAEIWPNRVPGAELGENDLEAETGLVTKLVVEVLIGMASCACAIALVVLFRSSS